MSAEKIDNLLLNGALLCLSLALLKLGNDSDKHKARLDKLEAEERGKVWNQEELARLHRSQEELAKAVYGAKQATAAAPRKAAAKAPRLTAVK